MSSVTTATKYTETDYMRLPEGFPAELIDGMFVKEPGPTSWHQEVGTRLLVLFRERYGPTLPSPIDVFIDEYNVLQPDVAVLPKDTVVSPARQRIPIPVLVAEVLSPSTRNRDRHTKTKIYLRAGVQEVWLVDPESESIEIVTASGRTRVHSGRVEAQTIPFAVELDELFRH